MAYCLTNLDASPVSYTLDPSEHIRALHHAESNKALEPEWLYFIVGLADLGRPTVRGFWIVDGVVTEEPIVLEAA